MAMSAFIPPGPAGRSAHPHHAYIPGCVERQEASIPAGAKCVFVDDLLATGGTLAAAYSLIKTVRTNQRANSPPQTFTRLFYVLLSQ